MGADYSDNSTQWGRIIQTTQLNRAGLFKQLNSIGADYSGNSTQWGWIVQTTQLNRGGLFKQLNSMGADCTFCNSYRESTVLETQSFVKLADTGGTKIYGLQL